MASLLYAILETGLWNVRPQSAFLGTGLWHGQFISNFNQIYDNMKGFCQYYNGLSLSHSLSLSLSVYVYVE